MASSSTTEDVLGFLDACVSGWTAPRLELPQVSSLKRSGAGQFRGLFGRWAGLGPYYAMFPMEFAVRTVRAFCPPQGTVLDPFAGRGTSVFAAAATGRDALGIEVHPAGWIYGKTKLHAAPLSLVLERLYELGEMAGKASDTTLRKLPEFFQWCFSRNVLSFLVTARRELNWKRSAIDRTLMSFLLTYLHNSDRRGLSNQMHQARSMAPDYSIRWWRARRMRPPSRDPVFFLAPRIAWRYRFGTPNFATSEIIRGDALRVLPDLQYTRSRFDLLFTSPPYYSVVNYHSDQWLRLWLLGGRTGPRKSSHISTGSFDNLVAYQRLLYGVFERCAELLSNRAAVYVRTDARDFTLLATVDALKYAFPKRVIRMIERPYSSRRSQTALFGDKASKPGEVDLVICGRTR